MAKKQKQSEDGKQIGTFRVPAEQMSLWPDISGNSINGLGETEKRRPSHVYWWRPDSIAHGPLQDYFYKTNNSPVIKKAQERRKKILETPFVPVASMKTNEAPEDFTTLIKDEARRLSSDDVGITRLSRDWIFDDCDFDLPWIIMLAVAMDYEKMRQAPDYIAGAEVIDQYGRGNEIAIGLTNWIHDRGFEAKPLAGPMAGPVTLIPAAIAAGLGELGKHGSIIHPKLGSCFRLSAVATDMPLVGDSKIEFGADDFCTRCQACSNACPPDAIFAAKQTVRGIQKWYVDFDRCLPYFNETAGCAICLTACPWSRPGVADKLLVKLAKSRSGT